jgi:NADP-dependent 3-hydroxy acid dehydrogenase YdfG
VRDDESIAAGIEEVLEEAGRIDGLVNNAGTTLLRMRAAPGKGDVDFRVAGSSLV